MNPLRLCDEIRSLGGTLKMLTSSNEFKFRFNKKAAQTYWITRSHCSLACLKLRIRPTRFPVILKWFCI